MSYLIVADNQDITNAGIHYLVESLDKSVTILNVKEKKDLTSLLLEYPDTSVIIDYTMFDFHSPNELMILYQRYPDVSWMLFSEDLSDNFLRFVLTNNLPFSIVLKSCSLEEIKEGINTLLQGSQYICLRTKAHMQTLDKSQIDDADLSLTNTEKEILKEIALGKTTKEIAADRFLSFHTVITHRKNIFRKLGVNNVHEATKYAIRAGIVDMTEYYI